MLSERLNFILKMGVLHDDIYLQGVLRRFELAQDFLGIEMQTGNAIKIPLLLCGSVYPISFRYYDPIFKIVK